ncbi:MAG: calcium/sodium antiporter [Lachnospiraceae bacterium]|nr:calcium/sodium antiporter [Lachnospiraceae bacterium]
MNVILAVCKLLAGFVFLIKGADFFVDGSSAIAKKLSVPTLIIGMTIVAMGTSLPELSVSVSASMTGNNSLSVSNVVGSDLFNILVILGASAFIRSLSVSVETLKRDYPIYMLSLAMLLGLGIAGSSLSQLDGILFLAVFVAFLALMVVSARKDQNTEEVESGEEISILKSVIFIVGGAVAIKLGGDWVVDGAVTIALAFGVSQTLVGLTIVALGTSLPEFVTSLVATKKGEIDMAVGNVIGSNIFNILLILGVAASLSPIAFAKDNVMDIFVLLIVSAVVWVFCITRKEINRIEGACMVAVYAGYMVYIVGR